MPSTVLVLPSSAVVLPEVAATGQEEVAAVRSAVNGAFHERSGRPEHVVIAAADPAAGDDWTWMSPGGEDGGARWVHLGGLGLPALTAEVAHPPEVSEDLSGADVQSHPRSAAHPGPDLSVLAVLASRALGVPPLLMALPARLSVRRADGLAELLSRVDLVICAGDLAAGHGAKPPRPAVGDQASKAFDELVAGSLDDVDVLPAVLERAPQVEARGSPALQLAAATARRAGLGLRTSETFVIDGVGSLVAAWR